MLLLIPEISRDLVKVENWCVFINQLFAYKHVLEALKCKSEARFELSVKNRVYLLVQTMFDDFLIKTWSIAFLNDFQWLSMIFIFNDFHWSYSVNSLRLVQLTQLNQLTQLINSNNSISSINSIISVSSISSTEFGEISNLSSELKLNMKAPLSLTSVSANHCLGLSLLGSGFCLLDAFSPRGPPGSVRPGPRF